MAVCGGCDFSYDDLLFLLTEEENIKNFILAHKLIKSKINCAVCGAELEMNKNYVFRCNKRSRVLVKTKKVFQPCNFYQSAFKGTWFSRAHLSVKEVLTLSYLWIQNGCTPSECERETRLSSKSVFDRFSRCREVAFDYCIKNSVKLGGVGKVVELYEAQFGKGKYSCGRITDSRVWAISGIERGSQNIFLATVDSRDEETLSKIIQENILPGTHISTDCCNFYENLEDCGYQVSTLEESKKFVDLASASNTQNSKKRSREVQLGIPIFSQKRIHLVGFLAESLFKWRFPDEGERFHAFLLHIAQMYSS